MKLVSVFIVLINSLCLFVDTYQLHSPYIYRRRHDYDSEYLATLRYEPDKEVNFSLIIHETPHFELVGYLRNVTDLLKTPFCSGKTTEDLERIFPLPSSTATMKTSIHPWLLKMMRPLIGISYHDLVSNIHQTKFRFVENRSIWLTGEHHTSLQTFYVITEEEPTGSSAFYKVQEDMFYKPNRAECDLVSLHYRVPNIGIVSNYHLDMENFKLDFFNTTFSSGPCGGKEWTQESFFSLKFQKFVVPAFESSGSFLMTAYLSQ